MNKIEDMVSIIMPVYNAERYIYIAIESVLKQTFTNWELIIIDDGSIDNTDHEIHKFKDYRIKLYIQNNSGVSAARNVGLKNMSGNFFCFLDADDFMPSKSLEYRINKMKGNPEIDYLDGGVEIYDRDMVQKLDYWLPSYQGNPIIPLLNISSTCFFSPTWLIRRKLKTKYQFNENLSHGEDLLFFIELALEGGKYDFVEETIMHYRKGHSSAMTDLKGLENGYHFIYRLIKNNKDVTPDHTIQFRKIAQNIIFKSYLGNYQPINALLSLINKW